MGHQAKSLCVSHTVGLSVLVNVSQWQAVCFSLWWIGDTVNGFGGLFSFNIGVHKKITQLSILEVPKIFICCSHSNVLLCKLQTGLTTGWLVGSNRGCVPSLRCFPLHKEINQATSYKSAIYVSAWWKKQTNKTFFILRDNFNYFLLGFCCCFAFHLSFSHSLHINTEPIKTHFLPRLPLPASCPFSVWHILCYNSSREKSAQMICFLIGSCSVSRHQKVNVIGQLSVPW